MLYVSTSLLHFSKCLHRKYCRYIVDMQYFLLITFFFWHGKCRKIRFYIKELQLYTPCNNPTVHMVLYSTGVSNKSWFRGHIWPNEMSSVPDQNNHKIIPWNSKKSMFVVVDFLQIIKMKIHHAGLIESPRWASFVITYIILLKVIFKTWTTNLISYCH